MILKKSTIISFILMAAFLTGCLDEFEPCPPDEERVARGYGAHCEPKPQKQHAEQPSEIPDGSVGLYSISKSDNECTFNEKVYVWNTNSFPISVIVSTFPPRKTDGNFIAKPNTTPDKSSNPTLIGYRKYSPKCEYINYSITSMAKAGS
jgi:hypothetical protein